MIIISYSSKQKKKKKKLKTNIKPNNKSHDKYPWYKYILTLYTLTLAKSTNTMYTKQPINPYLTWGCANVLGLYEWEREWEREDYNECWDCMRERGSEREGKTCWMCMTQETQTKNQIWYRDPDMIATWSNISPQFKNWVFETRFHFWQT